VPLCPPQIPHGLNGANIENNKNDIKDEINKIRDMSVSVK
jgi:hypothetical protein